MSDILEFLKQWPFEKAIFTVLLFAVIVIFLSSLGISVSSLIAELSIIGVAFSLAIQDFLSNVFGGIQTLYRPRLVRK